MPEVTVETEPNAIAVKINGVPHLYLRRSELLGIESWLRTTGRAKPLYYIYFEMRGGGIKSSYDDSELWKNVLKQLAAAKVFDEMLGQT